MNIRHSAARAACLALTLAAVLSLFPLASLWAQSPSPTIIPVALAPVQRDSPVELTALTLDANIAETDGHTLISGNSTFELHNSDKLNDLQIPVGFPSWAGDPYAFDPARLGTFSVSLDGKKQSLTPGRADLKIGGSVRNVDWYTFTLPIAADQKRTVRMDFQQDLGEGTLPRFTYGLLPAANWKGSIGSARLSLRFPGSTTLEQVASYDPPDPSFDGTVLTWSFTSHNPPSNPTLTLLRPSLWNELITRRRAVEQSPNDAGAHAALGGLLRQMATTPSGRQGSYSAQAIAELEMATRLDPNQSTARQALAALYESRAGPATGPRQSAYVRLAVAQWETLASGEGAARKQLAEDYFYLGVDAQTRGAFAEALSYMDKAAALSPSGAGPLFTPERAAAQRRALNTAWARNLADQGNFRDALARAQLALGNPFMSSFSPPPFTVSSAKVTMTAQSRTMEFHLAPFALSSDDLQKSVNDVAKALHAAGAETTITPTASDVALKIVVPFGSEADLKSALEALGQAVPDRAEWALARAVATPKTITWQDPGGLVMNALNYGEQADLAKACGSIQVQLGKIGAGLKPLEGASADDAEAQLKRALLTAAQNGWQQALAGGQVTYAAGADQEVAEACTLHTVAISSTPLRIQFIAALAAMVGLLSLAAGFLIWRSVTRVRARVRTRPRPRS